MGERGPAAGQHRPCPKGAGGPGARRRGRANFFGSCDFRRDHRQIRGTLDQPTATSGETLLHQTRQGINLQTSHAVRLGFDYDFTPGQSITLAVQPRFNPTSADETLDSRQTSGVRPPEAVAESETA